MVLAKLSPVFFGLLPIVMAMMVPIMGGATNVVLSVASITGGAMYFPIIWSLFAKRQNSYTVLGSTLLSLSISLGLKFLYPVITGNSLSRATEMVVGVLVPVTVIALSEIWLRMKNSPPAEYDKYQHYLAEKSNEDLADTLSSDVSDGENRFGKKMIAIGILSTGFMIGVLGLMATTGKIYVLAVAFVLLLIGGKILSKALK